MKIKRKKFDRVAKQIFVWAGNKPLEIKYSGFRFFVPPRDETAKPNMAGSIYKFESARDSKGELVPGSLLVHDIRNDTPEGGIHRVFDVNACCEYLSRDKADLFESGFGIVEDVTEIAPALQELLPDWERGQDRRAHAILQAEMERQKKFAEKGQVVPEREDPQTVEWAIKHLAQRRQAMKPAHDAAEIQAVLEGRFDDLPEAEKVFPKPERPEGQEAVGKGSRSTLYEECKAYGLNLTKREMQSLLDGDQDEIDYIRAKLDAKREEAASTA